MMKTKRKMTRRTTKRMRRWRDDEGDDVEEVDDDEGEEDEEGWIDDGEAESPEVQEVVDK